MARTTKPTKSSPGILYVILVELDGKSLVKIGVTHRRIEDRVVEILVSIFKKYREFPYCRPKRFKTVPNTYQKERLLHKHFSKYQYTPNKKFSGSTEFFDIPLDDVVKVYDDMVTTSSGKAKRKSTFFTVNRNIH
jgi:DUF4097 and DUF4098 domain-containing protein YvlB